MSNLPERNPADRQIHILLLLGIIFLGGSGRRGGREGGHNQNVLYQKYFQLKERKMQKQKDQEHKASLSYIVSSGYPRLHETSSHTN